MKISSFYKTTLVLILFLFASNLSNAYSVLTHEALIDASWDKEIKPMLKQKYKNVSDSQLIKAHAYAYGGAIIQDMGYYPLGSHFFTDLVHYVRSGDFVQNMLDEANNVNEYAFALGALCHYFADVYGHSIGTNKAVPIMYPKDKQQYGNNVSYAKDKSSHTRMEFGFDVLQTAKGNYKPAAYHDFIGFEVSSPVLERAFLKTYGIEAKSIFGSLPAAIATFRWSVKNLFPQLTKVAWKTKEIDITQNNPDATKKNYRYKMDRKSFRKEFGGGRNKPGIFHTIAALPIIFIPKYGPFKAFKFKPLNKEAEKLYVSSFDTVLAKYSNYLDHLKISKSKPLPDKDLDTGKPTEQGEYELTDEAYGRLLLTLQKKHFEHLNSQVKKDIIAFYSEPGKNIVIKEHPKRWVKITSALEELKNISVN
jgi:hypothetical protein